MNQSHQKAIAALSHMTAAAGIGVTAILFFQLGMPLIGANLIGPAFIWFMYKNRSDFIELHAREALNFQLTLLAVSAGFVGIMVWLSRIADGADHIQAIVILMGLAWFMMIVVCTLVCMVGAAMAYKNSPFCYLARFAFVKASKVTRISED